MRDSTFNAATRKLSDARSFAAVATLGPRGEPHTSLVWIDRDGEALVFSTLAGRQKARNLARDPRLSVTLFDLANPYHTVEIRRVAELLEDPARSCPTVLHTSTLAPIRQLIPQATVV
jgi:PPOX class probable F420-dependent enzyme